MQTSDPEERGKDRVEIINMSRSASHSPQALETDPVRVMKYLSLFLLMSQNVVLILAMRYARTRGGDMFFASTAVVMGETVKCVTCLLVILYQQKSFRKFWLHIQEHILQQPQDFARVSVPSLVYTMQNNLLYLAVSNLDAATFQVTYQLKIITTAVFSVIMMKKHLSHLQWLSLVLLFVGVSVVQMQPSNTVSSEETATEQRPLIGLLAVVVSSLSSGFAGVYFEKILKGTKQSLWIRNVQLGFLGTVIGFITMELKEGDKIRDYGFFFGYDSVVWMVILLQSLGGLLVAVVVKYADNILKGFATSAAIIMSCVVSIFFFDFKLTFQFSVGAACVVSSVYMYGKYAIVHTPPVKDHGKSNGKVSSI